MVANITHWCTPYVQTVQDIFILFKGPYPSYFVLKFGNNQDMAQNVFLQRS